MAVGPSGKDGEDTVARLARGEARAWDQLAARHGGRIASGAREVLREAGFESPADVEACLREVLASLLARGGAALRSGHGEEELPRLLAVLSRRLARGWAEGVRRLRRAQALTAAAPASLPGPLEAAACAGSREDLADALQALPEPEREAVVRYAATGLVEGPRSEAAVARARSRAAALEPGGEPLAGEPPAGCPSGSTLTGLLAGAPEAQGERGHVRDCPTCGRRLRRLALEEGLLAWVGSRLGCPSPETLARRASGRLPGPEEDALSEHVPSCAACASELASAASAPSAAAAPPDAGPGRPEPGFEALARAAWVARATGGQGARRRVVPLAALGAAALALALALGPFRPRDDPPPPAPPVPWLPARVGAGGPDGAPGGPIALSSPAGPLHLWTVAEPRWRPLAPAGGATREIAPADSLRAVGAAAGFLAGGRLAVALAPGSVVRAGESGGEVLLTLHSGTLVASGSGVPVEVRTPAGALRARVGLLEARVQPDSILLAMRRGRGEAVLAGARPSTVTLEESWTLLVPAEGPPLREKSDTGLPEWAAGVLPPVPLGDGPPADGTK